MLDPPQSGRVFRRRRNVRLGDVRPDGELRLDGLTRYTQDVSNDDTSDAALDDDLAWVVRSTAIEVSQPARFGESIELATFAAGVGRSWAERRIDVTGSEGALYRVASLWIYLDPEAGRPRRLTEQFFDTYGQAANGRQVSARLRLPAYESEAVTETIPWEIRRADIDLQNHVNNSVYWAALEERVSEFERPFQLVMEYREGVGSGDQVTIARAVVASQEVWWWRVGDRTAATAAVLSLTDA